MKLHRTKDLKQMQKTLTILSFMILVLFSTLNANEQRLNLNTIIDTTIKENKQVVVFFHMDDCGYCNRMKNRTFQNQEIQSIIQDNFILVDININHKESVLFNQKLYSKKEFSNSVDVDFYPTVLFFDENYDVTYMVRGFRDHKKFKEILQFIETKSYESMDFFDYEQQIKNKEEK